MEWGASEQIRQNTLNPVTKQFEMLTGREWFYLTVGLPKEATVSKTVACIVGGSKWIAIQFFNDVCKWQPLRLSIIEKLYKEWYPRNPSEQELLGWVKFIKDNYDLEGRFILYEKTFKTMAELQESMAERKKLAAIHKKKVQEEWDK